MRYFLDTEFIERGPGKPIDLISIGAVCEDGREFYAVSTEFKARHANEWVKRNVLPYLPDRNVDAHDSPRRQMEAAAWMPLHRIVDEFHRFVFEGKAAPEFWGWCCGYDYVVVSQLIGFDTWSSGWPHYFRDIQQEADRRGFDLASHLPENYRHHALEDARQIQRFWDSMVQTKEYPTP